MPRRSSTISPRPPPDWAEHFVTAYASTHPWEDFAETWAHYFHMVDTLETASAFGLSLRPRLAKGANLAVTIDFDRTTPTWTGSSKPGCRSPSRQFDHRSMGCRTSTRSCCRRR